MLSISCGCDVPVFRRVRSGLGKRMVGMAAGHQLDGHVGDDVPGLSEVTRHIRTGRWTLGPAVDFEKPALGLENALFRPISALRCLRGSNTQHCRQPGMIFARGAGVCRGHQSADRGRREGHRLRHLRCVEAQQPAGGNSPRENSDQAAMKSTGAKAGCDRLADAPGRLVAEDDCRQHVFASRSIPLGHGERRGDECRTGMDDVAQIAVVGSRCVAHHGIDLRRLGYRQFWPCIEPQRGFGDAAAFSREVADDDRRFYACAERRAGERAGDQHRGMIDRVRREVGRADPSQKLRQFTGDRHPRSPI